MGTRRVLTWASGVVVVVIVALVVMAAAGERSRRKFERGGERRWERVAEAAREAVLARLKSPGSAKFAPAGREACVRVVKNEAEAARLLGAMREHEWLFASKPDPAGKSDAWRVDLVVDAQNGFGALIRGRWSVFLRDDGDSFKVLATESSER